MSESSLKVLIIDDNKDHLFLLKMSLESLQTTKTIDVNTSQKVEEVITETGDYDAVFLDLAMPRMNGFEAAEVVKAQETPPTKLFAYTCFQEMESDCNAAGFDGILHKPFTVRELGDLLAPCL